MHDHHQVGQGHGLLLAVGDVDEADAELHLQPLQLLAHPDPQERIEGGQGLIQQQDARIGDQGAGQRHPLLLAARELGRLALGVAVHMDQLEQLHRLGSPLGRLDAAHLEAEGDIVDAIQMREQRVALEHHGGAALDRRQAVDHLVADHDVASAQLLMAGDHAQGGGLAATGWAKQAAIAAAGDLQADAIDGDGPAVALDDADQLDISCRGQVVRSPRRRIDRPCSATAVPAPARWAVGVLAGRRSAYR